MIIHYFLLAKKVLVIFFGSGGKQFLVLCTYLVYNTVVRLCQFFCCFGKVNFVRIPYSHVCSSKISRTFFVIHLLRVGWRNLFSSCAVVSVFGSGGKQILVLFTMSLCTQSTIQLWCCVSFLVLEGKSFWCYVRTQCNVQISCAVVSVFWLWREIVL